MLLDASITVSCTDLQFTHSVWRSSKHVPVGYIPRLHHMDNNFMSSKNGIRTFRKSFNISTMSFAPLTNVGIDKLSKDAANSTTAPMERHLQLATPSFFYHNGLYVWWYQRYSIILSKAIMIRAKDLQVLPLHSTCVLQCSMQRQKPCLLCSIYPWIML